ncbi:MAG: methionine ABC transporter permease [Clostridiales bacterium]|nr:ABC transporter permease [Bacillota bacterium]MEE0516517.1 methionine ABC transporter permease [Anaerovoracaceae bacterium]PWL94208.1 MAG: methionine ABC transporter permease [Clostridiales bacterium]
MFNGAMVELLGTALWETVYMVIISTILAYVLGLPIGIVLNITSKDGVCPNKAVNSVLGVIVNVFRSIPFLILLIWMLPFTMKIVGTMVGPTSVIVPLVVSAAPFVGRMVESSLNEIDHGVIEAAQSMGSSSWQIIYKVLIPEAKPSLLIGAAISVTTILGYSAMAGIVGGGGLGAVATNYGLYRYNNEVMLVTIVIIVVIVQIFQEIGMMMAKKLDKRLK